MYLDIYILYTSTGCPLKTIPPHNSSTLQNHREDESGGEIGTNTDDTQSLTIYSKSGSNSFLSGLFKKTYEYRSLTLMRDPTTGSLWLETGPPTGYLLLSPTSIGVVDEVTDWGSAINSSYLIAHPPFNSCSQDKGKQYHEKRLRLADLTEYWLADWKEWRRSYRSDSSTSTPPEEVSKKILNRFSDCAVMNADKETLEVVRPFLRKGLTREERGLDDWLDVKGFVR